MFLLFLFLGMIALRIEAKPVEEIYQEKLAQLASDDVKGYYQLGVWCEQNKLPEQAQTQFKNVIELDPDHVNARKKLGHIKYEGKWMSPEEMTAKGLVKYKDKWMTYEEMMKVKGMVQFEGQWITPGEKKRLEAYAKKVESLIKRFPSQGVLDKPGADNENLPWEQARVKATDHFVVKTNLSENALNDICFLMECAYLNWLDFFAFVEPKGKLNICVFKNRDEFERAFRDWTGTEPPSSSKGGYMCKETRSSYETILMAYYYPATQDINTSSLLLHEGTHYSIELIKRACAPVWLGDGLATYFESGKLEDKKLVINLVNQIRLPVIQNAINNNTHIKLKDFINLTKPEFFKNSSLCYPQSWSLMYFLINGQQGKYKAGVKAYLEAWRKNKIAIQPSSEIIGKPAHLKLFEECMDVPIDQLEKEWKEYVLNLTIKTTDNMK
jgi:tetratricopeptide (TPR) repeat protein